MRIAIEAQRIFRKKKHGMDIVALELIRHLQEIDKENEYFILVKRGEDKQGLSKTENFHILELPVAPYPIWEQYHLRRAIKKINPDILHCTSSTAPINIKVPLVLTLHDIIFMNKGNYFRGSRYQQMGNLYRNWLLPKIIGHCTKIITVSNFERNNISNYFPRYSDKILFIYNASSNNFKLIEEKEKLLFYQNKYNLPKKFILFLGNTDPKKNFLNTLIALDDFYGKNNGVDIPTVIPDISKYYLSHVFSKFNNQHLEGRIQLTGYIPNNELVYIYNAASLFLYPSLYESFGIPILEAMACGVPVITSNQSAIPEIAGESAILIDPENPSQIADAIHEILNDEVRYRNLQKKGLKRASDFSWEKTAQSVLDIYREIDTSKTHPKRKLTIQ